MSEKTRCRFVAFAPELFRAMAPEADRLEDHARLCPLADFMARMPSWIMLRDAEVLGAGGLVEQWRGRWVVWMIAAARAEPKHWYLGWRFGLARIERLQREQAPVYRRIEATAQAARPAAIRLIERSGFAYEGRLKAFGIHGEDQLMFARLAGGAAEEAA